MPESKSDWKGECGMNQDSVREGPGKLVVSMLLGSGISLLMMVALCMGAAALFAKGTIPEQMLQPVAWLVCALSIFSGCRAALRGADQMRLPVSLGCAFVSMLVLALAQLLVFRTPAALPGVTAAVSAAMALLAAVLGSRKKPHRHRRAA